MRKFPINYTQYKLFRGHQKLIRHGDTTLWFWQVFTGFALFFLASVHLYLMLTQPHLIGPFESADRVWTGACGRSTSCCCSPSRCTAASASTGWR